MGPSTGTRSFRASRLPRRKRLLLALPVIAVATAVAVDPDWLFALPTHEVQTLYRDQNNQLVAETFRFCDGTFHEYGDRSLAQPGNYTQQKTACSDDVLPSYQICYGDVDSQGYMHPTGGCW